MALALMRIEIYDVYRRATALTHSPNESSLEGYRLYSEQNSHESRPKFPIQHHTSQAPPGAFRRIWVFRDRKQGPGAEGDSDELYTQKKSRATYE